MPRGTCMRLEGEDKGQGSPRAIEGHRAEQGRLLEPDKLTGDVSVNKGPCVPFCPIHARAAASQGSLS